MISIQDIIKYVALALIIYFLTKAFANNLLTNTQIIILVIIIMIVIIFLMNMKTNCPTYINKEHFESSETDNQSVNSSVDPNFTDLQNVVGVDKQTYQNLIDQEQDAMNRIRAGYQNEMIYTNTNPLNTVPLGSQLYGYTFLPPANWFRAYEKPPACITDKRSVVHPSVDPSTAGLLEFDTYNNIRAPQGINLDYVRNVLNDNKN